MADDTNETAQETTDAESTTAQPAVDTKLAERIAALEARNQSLENQLNWLASSENEAEKPAETPEVSDADVDSMTQAEFYRHTKKLMAEKEAAFNKRLAEAEQRQTATSVQRDIERCQAKYEDFDQVRLQAAAVARRLTREVNGELIGPNVEECYLLAKAQGRVDEAKKPTKKETVIAQPERPTVLKVAPARPTPQPGVGRKRPYTLAEATEEALREYPGGASDEEE